MTTLLDFEFKQNIVLRDKNNDDYYKKRERNIELTNFDKEFICFISKKKYDNIFEHNIDCKYKYCRKI